MDCIKDIIGVTKNGCDCLEIDASKSLSGLYLDDTTEGRIPLSSALFDCGDPNTKSFLERVVEDAKNAALEELTMSLEDFYIKKVIETKVKVPKKSDYSGAVANGNYYTFSIRPLMPDLVMKINSFDVLTISGSIDDASIIEIYQDGKVIESGTKSDLAGKKIHLKTDTIFKFEATQPRNHKHRCCGNSESYGSLVRMGGSSENGSDILFKESQYSHGVKMDASIYCDPYSFMCGFDFTQGWGLVFAKTVQLIARKSLASWILDSGKVTTYTTTNQDRLLDLMNWYDNQIEKRLKFLPTRYSYSNCYCNSRHIQGTIEV